MVESPKLSVVTVGGKGWSLSSALVYAIAKGHSHLQIDPSALRRLSDGAQDCPTKPCDILNFSSGHFTAEECRASLLVLLNSILAGSTVRATVALLLAEALNLKSWRLEIGLTADEAAAIGAARLTSSLFGIFALVDHGLEKLSAFADAVAAISSEASKADVKAFDLIDSGEGCTAKEEEAVAGDMKAMLNGSELAVVETESEAFLRIPKIHGCLREQSKLVHSKSRVQLNSGVKSKKGGGPGSAGGVGIARTVLLPLAAAMWDVGSCSLVRTKMNLDSVTSEEVRSSLALMIEEECPSGERLRNEFRAVSELVFEGEENYDEFGHQVNALSALVWKVLSWEAIAAYVALESAELEGKGKVGEVNGVKIANAEKKVVLGRGTSVFIESIKTRLESRCGDADGSPLLEKRVEGISSFLDHDDVEFGKLLNRLKEIVESDESRRLPKLPKGARDFATERMAMRQKSFSIVEDVFRRHGGVALDTPVFELRETLRGKYGEDSKLIYDLADQGGELYSLRYELTVPFARYLAMNGITSFRRYQIAKVYRRDGPSEERCREFYQCDFDIAGQCLKMGPDFEIIKILTELLDELEIGDYEIRLNHRKLLDGMLEMCGVPSEKFRTICSSIDKLDKQPFELIKKEMVEKKGVSVETADMIGTFVKERGYPLELLPKIKKEGSKFLENSSSSEALNELEILFNLLDKSKCIDRVTFDLSLVRGLDWYTGVIFEAVFKGGAQVGSIAVGGRYDNLVGMFGARQVPAVGVSLAIERVFDLLEQRRQDQN